MTASSDWSVPRAERGREIHETAPVAHQDKRFPRRAPAGNRRRERNPHGAADDDAPPPKDGEADATPDRGDTDETGSGGEDHVIDTLA